MDLPDSQLQTLLAIADLGTFDAAAERLSLTPSAVSQRIRALESSVGRVLLQRTTPCRPTQAGEVLIRLARQRALLDGEARSALSETGAVGEDGDDGPPVELPVAVNADSLCTWLRPLLSEVATWPGLQLNLRVEDQGYSSELLRRGEVLGAITSEDQPVQGCSTSPLGVMRYRPAATRELADRYRQGRGYDWQAMPAIRFNAKDHLQHDFLLRRGVQRPRVTHLVPTSDDFWAAVRAGLGWGMIPEQQLDEPASDGLVLLHARERADVPLYWMRWRLRSPLLDRLGDGIATAARAGLVRP